MTLDEQVKESLERSASNKIMLDAFLQWATNPTSMSAGWGLEENYTYIGKNLKLRHQISDAETDDWVRELRETCGRLIECAQESFVEPKRQVGEVKRHIRQEIMGRDSGLLLRQEVLHRLEEVSEDTRRALLLIQMVSGTMSSVDINSLREPISSSWNPQGRFQAYMHTLFGQTAPSLKVIQESVWSGTYNELFWVPSPGAKSSPAAILVEGVIPTIAELEALGTKSPETPDFSTMFSNWRNEGDFAILRLVDLASHAQYGVVTTKELLPAKVDQLGLLGRHGQLVAVSPVIVDDVQNVIDEIKFQLTEGTRSSIEAALLSLEHDAGPDWAIQVLFSKPSGETLWVLRHPTNPPFCVYLGSWLSGQPNDLLREVHRHSHLLLVIPHQSPQSIVSAIDDLRISQSIESVSLISTLETPTNVRSIQGTGHLLLSQFVNLLSGSTDPAPALVPVPVPVPPINPPSGPGDGTTSESSAIATEEQKQLLECFTSDYAVKPLDPSWLTQLQTALKSILTEFGIDCTVDSTNFEVGPRLLRANVTLGKGVRIKKVKDISHDLANRLFANRDLFHWDDEAPQNVRVDSVPQMGMVGISIPRDDFEPVRIGTLLKELLGKNRLSFVIGQNVVGEEQFSDLTSMPHLLVAGQPGAGKSVFLNTVIISLAIQNSPQQIEFVLIDPKGGLEFGPYARLPHVFDEVVTDAEQALEALASCRQNMDERYDIMSKAAAAGPPVRSLDDYNKLPGLEPIPYRVIIIDEFADLVFSRSGQDIVELVQAIAQKGRAAGVHVVLCTQRPGVKVIPGDIKAVIPSRLSFRLPSQHDSRVILDEPGAEDLIGRGDFFMKETLRPDMRRFQGAFITDEEIHKFVSVSADIWG